MEDFQLNVIQMYKKKQKYAVISLHITDLDAFNVFKPNIQ